MSTQMAGQIISTEQKMQLCIQNETVKGNKRGHGALQAHLVSIQPHEQTSLRQILSAARFRPFSLAPLVPLHSAVSEK